MEQNTVTFLIDLTVALVAATVFGALARAAKITPALGYVLAGVVIGPFTPGYHTSAVSLGGLSELGLILLLFSLGLGFSPRELRAVGAIPMIGNLALMAGFAAAAWALGMRFGFTHPITLGLAFTLSSTAIGVALLARVWTLGQTCGAWRRCAAHHPRSRRRPDSCRDDHAGTGFDADGRGHPAAQSRDIRHRRARSGCDRAAPHRDRLPTAGSRRRAGRVLHGHRLGRGVAGSHRWAFV